MQNTKEKVFFPGKSKSSLGSSKSYFSSTNNPKLRQESSLDHEINTSKNKNYDLHTRLVNTFQGFVLQMDELSLCLKAEERITSNGYSPEFTNYHDICDKLRQEMLIAIDKLKITSSMTNNYNDKNVEFLHKMNSLTYQLADIRCQYHRAIKNFET